MKHQRQRSWLQVLTHIELRFSRRLDRRWHKSGRRCDRFPVQKSPLLLESDSKFFAFESVDGQIGGRAYQ
uniref:Uncharacterized protein n=1 Tax=Romanomermis culicivorax TaxID=13658 RepID=A0A915IWG6_ROMCU